MQRPLTSLIVIATVLAAQGAFAQSFRPAPKIQPRPRIGGPIQRPTSSPGSCSAYLGVMFATSDAPKRYLVKGTRTSVRGGSSFSSYAMDQRYRHTQDARTKASAEQFVMSFDAGARHWSASFLEVFPGDSHPERADRTTLRFLRDGRVQIVLNSWNNAVTTLSNVQCYAYLGNVRGAFMLLGQGKYGADGIDQWNFVLAPQWALLI